jgi:putative transposase
VRDDCVGSCRRFGVSRRTGYKILDRHNSCGLQGLTDRSRRPCRHANQLPAPIETLIVPSKQERAHWGAPKIQEQRACRANRLDQWHPAYTAGPSTVVDLLEGPLRVWDQTPQRSAAVCTEASHSFFAWLSSTDTVIETPAMSRDVT